MLYAYFNGELLTYYKTIIIFVFGFWFREKLFFHKKSLVYFIFYGKYRLRYRIVVQPGRTLRSGRRGRWFESSQSDQRDKKPPVEGGFFCYVNQRPLFIK